MVDRIELVHGAGGSASESFVKKYILPHIYQPDLEVPLEALDDGAVVNGIAFTTDSHTVIPLIFPGGNIGSLAVAGTINDVAVMGAWPLALSLGMVIEEGLTMETFNTIVKSIGELSKAADVPIITGDTKVVEQGGVQGLIINTTGIGQSSNALQGNMATVDRKTKWLRDNGLRPGDKLIISGSVADHGIAVLSCREGYAFSTRIVSDVAPIHTLMQECLTEGGVVAAKDPTRGGVANALNEMAAKSGVGMTVFEESIPVQTGTLAACEMLGIDPLTVGNEGKVILGVLPDKADDILKIMHNHPLGRKAAIIGEVDENRTVVLETAVGGRRILEAPVGDPIPRIC
jgi:hydrogenase expression/formation protein HypE